MKTIEKAKIIRLENPAGTRRYNVQILRSIDGGKTFFYTGGGTYCSTFAEAMHFKNLIEA